MENEAKKFYFYTLRCSDAPDRVRYVGTTSRNIQSRFCEHKYKANSQNPTQPVHKWMKSKYLIGLDIICEYLDECSIEEWENREQYWIAYYRNLEPELLNLQKGGAGVITNEMRNTDGKLRSVEAHKKSVIAYDLDGNEVMRYTSIVEATKAMGFKSKSTIGMAVKHGTKAGNYYWKLNPEEKPKLEPTVRNSEYNKRKIVYKFSLNGELIQEYQSIRSVLREYNKSGGNSFSTHVLDKNYIWNGYLWSTSKDYTIDPSKIYNYYEIDEDGNVIKNYQHRKEISDIYNVSLDTISEWIKSKKITKNKTIICKY